MNTRGRQRTVPPLLLVEAVLLLLLLLCTGNLEARRKKQRARSGDTISTELPPSAPEWSHRMTTDTTVTSAAGGQVVLSCQALGSPRPSITWFRDGQPLRPMEGEQLKMKGWRLKIIDVLESQSGNYTCIVENDFGQISWTFKLLITKVIKVIQPMISSRPRNQTVTQGEAAHLECQVVGDEEYLRKLSVQWLKHYTVNGSDKDADGFPLVKVLQEVANKYEFPSRHALRVHNISHDDMGWYTCMITHSEDESVVAHATAYVDVGAPSGATPHPTGTGSTSPRSEVHKRRKHKGSRGRKRQRATEAPPTMESTIDADEAMDEDIEDKEERLVIGQGVPEEVESTDIESQPVEREREEKEDNVIEMGVREAEGASSEESSACMKASSHHVILFLLTMLFQFFF